MAADSSERFLLLNQLGEEFAERFRRGERPALQEYIDRHPELADEIREFFPEMVEMEQVKEDREEVTEPAASAHCRRWSGWAITGSSARSAAAAWASSTRPSRSRWAGTWR